MKLLGNGPSLRVGKPPSPMAIYLFGLAYRQTRILNHSKHARKVGAFVHHTISVPKQPSPSRRYFLNPFVDQRCHFRVPNWHSVRNQSCIRALAQLLQEQDYCSISLCATFKEVTRIIRWQSTRGAKWKLAFSVLVPSEGWSPCLLPVSQVYTFRGCFWGKTSRFSFPIRVTLLKAETQQRYIEALGTFGFFIPLPTSHTDSSSACRWVCTIWGQQRHSISPLIRHPCRMLLMNAAPRYLVGLLVSFANSRTDICTRWDDTFTNDLLGAFVMYQWQMVYERFYQFFEKIQPDILTECTHTKLLLFRSSSPSFSAYFYIDLPVPLCYV